MNLVGEENEDEYIVTALKIFLYCGADSGSTLRVDALMDKLAPFVKTNKSLLDPDQNNPEVTVSMLANSLDKYSKSQEIKVDLDESFNLKTEQLPHDSDSGISTDGFQLLEELQCQVREKTHIAQQLRTQLEYSDRQNEEALATVTKERDSLRAHLNMLREENTTLTHVRRDYEDVCERLCSNDRALEECRRELESIRRRAKVLTEQVSLLENEKLTLQELLSKSKDECHRINDMYASRQSSLLEENETLRTEHADLSAKLQDQEEYMQQIIKEKVLLEMELKDLLNKSNQTHLRMERSFDVSYTEDQMLTVLDSLNADSRFAQDNRLLDQESFVNAIKEDQGRPTNMSLFDEIRLSFCNMSRNSLIGLNSTQPNEKLFEVHCDYTTVASQTDSESYIPKQMCDNCQRCRRNSDTIDVTPQIVEKSLLNNRYSDDSVLKEEQFLIRDKYKLTRTLSAQAISLFKNEPYYAYDKDVQNRKIETVNKSTNTSSHVFEIFKDVEVMNFGTQTDTMGSEFYINNNNIPTCVDCSKCIECERLKKFVVILEVKINKYEDNLDILNKSVNNENEENRYLKTIVENLGSRLNILDRACATQEDKIKELHRDILCTEVQSECELSSVSTQADVPCTDCVKRSASRRSLRRYFWEPLKGLFQLFALVCFLCAVWLLCGVARRGRICHDTPWRWLHTHDLLDLLLTVERAPDVPM